MRTRAIVTGTVAAATIIAAVIAWRAVQTPASQQAILPASAMPATPQRASLVALKTPRPLAPLSFVNGDGAPMTLSDFHGRVVLLNVWATWCVPCRQEMPALDRLQAKLGGPDFTVIPLSIDHRGRDAVRRFYQQLGLSSLEIYVDTSGDTIHAINALGLPQTLLIDRQGRELDRAIGAAEWDGSEMMALIADHLEAQDRDHR